MSMNWGVNKTMGQIHGLLLVSGKPKCCDEIMDELSISRGSVNMNIRALHDWDLVHKVYIQGHRKDFYKAEKDVFKMFQAVLAMRRKKELVPLLRTLDELKAVEHQEDGAECFHAIIDSLARISQKANTALDKVSTSENNWMTGAFLKMMR